MAICNSSCFELLSTFSNSIELYKIVFKYSSIWGKVKKKHLSNKDCSNVFVPLFWGLVIKNLYESFSKNKFLFHFQKY